MSLQPEVRHAKPLQNLSFPSCALARVFRRHVGLVSCASCHGGGKPTKESTQFAQNGPRRSILSSQVRRSFELSSLQ
jgi:hypothetical protein